MMGSNPSGGAEWECDPDYISGKVDLSDKIIVVDLTREERTMHSSTFEYLKPTDQQMLNMTQARNAAYIYADIVDKLVPDGPDKTYILRKFREVAMWVNMSITRNPDGSPRS